jgi:hypothetical protein
LYNALEANDARDGTLIQKWTGRGPRLLDKKTYALTHDLRRQVVGFARRRWSSARAVASKHSAEKLDFEVGKHSSC